MATRRYEQRVRAQSAQDTRRRILDALYERLRDAPAEPVSIDRIARMAGVARSTVYVVFGSRAGLFDAFAEDLMARAGFRRVVEAINDPDPRVHLREGIRGGVLTFAEDRAVLRALVSMAALDGEAVGGVMQRQERRRTRGMAHLAQRLADNGLLREGVSVEAAAHLLFVLTSFDGFDLLYTGRGLPAEEVARVLVETAERSLLTPAAGTL